MYPLKFENIYCEKVWGGYDLSKFRDNVPVGKIGESWDVACHPNGMSVVKNGKYKGIRLDELINTKGQDLIGTKISKDQFPLLVKILNTSDKLSVQVHPDDEYALIHEKEMGKTEVWYVMEAEEGAFIILGTNGCTKEEFKKGIEDKNIEDYMNKIEVKKGDVYYLKSGLIHSMGPGIVIAEIQQNSDTTYRVYDYDRGRELHIEKALDVIDFKMEGKRSSGIKIENEDYDKTYYCLNEHFSLELYNVKTCLEETSDKERFFIFTCVEGDGLIKYKDGEEKINLGDSIFIPANLGKYEFVGELGLLKSYVPNIAKVEEEILGLLR
jgi:mannose-6-phosphate isomerase